MEKGKFLQALLINKNINHLKEWAGRITHNDSSGVPIFWRFGYDSYGQIEDEELNDLISNLVIDYVEGKVKDLQIEFDKI